MRELANERPAGDYDSFTYWTGLMAAGRRARVQYLLIGVLCIETPRREQRAITEPEM